MNTSPGRDASAGIGKPSPAHRRRILAYGTLAATVTVLAIYRIFTFVPQRIDSTSALRPKLFLVFRVLCRLAGGPDQLQVKWETLCLALLAVAPFLAFANYLSEAGSWSPPRWAKRFTESRLALFGAIGATLFAFRFPVLLVAELNPDESQFLAAALKLLRDPVFFRSVDCGTVGPVDIFPLLLPAAFHIQPDYASGRCITMLMILASIYVIYRIFGLLMPDAWARIAVLPAAGAFAVLRHPDLLHYSSEHFSFLFLVLAIYAALRVFQAPERYARHVVLLGFLLSLTYFAKVQPVPILLCITAIAVLRVHHSGAAKPFWRPCFLLGCGLAPLVVLNAAVCLMAGVWHDFWMAYVVANASYITVHDSFSVGVSKFLDFALSMSEIRWMVATLLGSLAAYRVLLRRRDKARGLHLFLQTGGVAGVAAIVSERLLREANGVVSTYASVFSVLMLGGVFLWLWRDGRPDQGGVRWGNFTIVATVIAATVVAYAPQRLTIHYLLLLIFPLALAISWPLVACLRREETVAVPYLLAFTLLVLCGQIVQAGTQERLPFSKIADRIGPPHSDVVADLTRPGEEISVWGWDASLYLTSGRTPAIRDTNMANIFRGDPRIDSYYRERFLADMNRTRPVLFVDAAASSPWIPVFADRSRTGYALIPEIDSYLSAHYQFVTQAYGERLYIRRDLARSVAGIAERLPCDAKALRCFVAEDQTVLPVMAPAVTMPPHAFLDATFTVETTQSNGAVIFSNDADSHGGPRGFRLEFTRDDHYKLVIGTGTEWLSSSEILLPKRRPIHLTVEFTPASAKVTVAGQVVAELVLPKPMADSDGGIWVGSESKGTLAFMGNIQQFQIRDAAAR